MDPILNEIDKALRERGLTDAAASKLAVGHPSLLKNLRLPVEGEKRYNLPALKKLADVLGLEFYFGPPRDTGPVSQVVLNEGTFALVPMHGADLAAGDGAENGHEGVIDHLAFRQTWLSKIGVSASNAVIARAKGDSMLPLIHDGDLLLIDRSRRTIPVTTRSAKDTRPSPIYAIVDDGCARVKRIERPEEGLAMLLSDNPAFGPEVLLGPRIQALKVIGKVVWWGHTNFE